MTDQAACHSEVLRRIWLNPSVGFMMRSALISGVCGTRNLQQLDRGPALDDDPLRPAEQRLAFDEVQMFFQPTRRMDSP